MPSTQGIAITILAYFALLFAMVFILTNAGIITDSSIVKISEGKTPAFDENETNILPVIKGFFDGYSLDFGLGSMNIIVYVLLVWIPLIILIIVGYCLVRGI